VQSGARVHHPEGDGLSTMDPRTAQYRGAVLKRHIRAAAALRGFYDDSALARELGIGRNTVGKWWTGVHPEAENLAALERVTGYDAAALWRFIEHEGPMPPMPTAAEPEPDEVDGQRRYDELLGRRSDSLHGPG
jgi:transcriptional regulator with XRE-family HTH domain